MKASEIHCGVYRGKDGTLRQVVSVGQEIEGGEKHWFVNWYRHPIDSAQHGRSTRRVNFARWAVERVEEGSPA